MDASIRGDRASIARRPTTSSLPGLRVALVHDWLTGMRGGEKCLEVLCRAFPEATLHTLIHRRGALSPAIEAMAIRPSLLQHVPGVLDHYRKLLPLMPLATRTWHVGQVDLVISLSHCVAKMVRPPAGVPHVCYCFTPMRYAWDGREAYLDSWSDRPVRRALAGRLLDRLQAQDRETSSRVSHFVAISETVRERIARCYGRESRVIQPPVDADFYTPSPIPREDFYLCVSALVPYKNLDQAVIACSRSGRPLVVIGSGPERSRLERLAGPSVRFLGWQPDEVIRDHYRRCRALLFPGEEDFGIVPIEALGCEAPVIALGRGGAAETVDHRVGRTYLEPSADALQATLDSWEADSRPHDPTLARELAESLALPVFRRKLLGYLEEVVSSHRQPRGIPSPHLQVSSGILESS
ncbi:glycosyltransferase [Tundrisphaera lichenicola]|uniref:glycosyltransferase n=1 Tax=Tundrisphaera lichenicola TaxID=2029860 RepID=UPI003EBC8222